MITRGKKRQEGCFLYGRPSVGAPPLHGSASKTKVRPRRDARTGSTMPVEEQSSGVVQPKRSVRRHEKKEAVTTPPFPIQNF